MVTILAMIGIVVVGIGGFFLSCRSSREYGQFHAIPGILIAALAAAVIYRDTETMREDARKRELTAD